jgi:hypothetical protein
MEEINDKVPYSTTKRRMGVKLIFNLSGSQTISNRDGGCDSLLTLYSVAF